MIIIHYEVYVQEARGWILHARFPRSDRDEAIREARELEALLNCRVKVLRETYYTDSNAFEEAEVYMTGMAAGAMPAPQQPAGRPAGGGRPGGGGGRPAAGRPAGGQARRPAPQAGRTVRHASRAPRTTTASSLLWRVTFITIASLGAALAAIRAVPNLVLWLFEYGFRITPDAYGQLLFGVFITVFLLVAVPSALRFLPSQAEITIRKPTFSLLAAAKAAREREVKASLEKLVKEAAAPAPQKPPEPEPAAKPEPEAETLPDITPRPDDENLPEIRPDPPEQPARKAAEGDPADYGALNLAVTRFLGSAITRLKNLSIPLDKYNKFALNLYLAGAVQQMGDTRRLGDPVQFKLLREAMETLGTSAEMARRFHDKLDEYMLEPRYLHIIQTGRNAMDAWMGGREADPHGALGDALKEWNKPQDKRASIITVMFTDMVGSTDMTQTRGDLAAQDIVRRHNAIVRTALSQFSGREVKHTGDGIMASFTSAANAIEAAIAIQRQIGEHNARLPDQELHLRIGLNAGEPIQEEDDLFGTTVQLAARVCNATDADHILCTQVVRDLSFGKSFDFLPAGEQELKGFKDPVALYEIRWPGQL